MAVARPGGGEKEVRAQEGICEPSAKEGPAEAVPLHNSDSVAGQGNILRRDVVSCLQMGRSRSKGARNGPNEVMSQ